MSLSMQQQLQLPQSMTVLPDSSDSRIVAIKHSVIELCQTAWEVFQNTPSEASQMANSAASPNQLMEVKRDIENLFADFKREQPEVAMIEEFSAFEAEIMAFFNQAQQVDVSANDKINQTSWQIERFEATFESLSLMLNELQNKYGVNQSFIQYLDDGQNLNDFEKDVKVLCDLIRQEKRTDKPRFDDREYFNDLYVSYHKGFFYQLRKLIASPFYQEFIKDNYDNWDNLNDLEYAECVEDQQKQIIGRFIREFSAALYTGVNLEKTNVRLVENTINRGAEIRGSEDRFADYLDMPLDEYFANGLPQMYKDVAAARNSVGGFSCQNLWNGFLGQINCGFDSNVQNNPIHKMGEIVVKNESGEKKIIANLAFGSQTREFCFANAKVAPEFADGFLENYRQNGKRHLYIFHQDLIPPLKIEAKSTNVFINFILKVLDFLIQVTSYIPILNLPILLLDKLLGNESFRGEALIQLAQEERMRDTFCFMALTKNSRFYQQSSSYYHSMNDFDKFHSELRRQFFEMDYHESGIYFSPNLIEKMGGILAFQTSFENIIRSIHEELFEGKESLSVEERKTFICQLYANLDRHLLVNPDGDCLFDSFNTSCRADIDRGMSEEALLEADIALKQMNLSASSGEVAPLDERGFKREIAKTFFARAMLVDSRPLVESRLTRALEAIQFLTAHLSSLGALNSRLMGNHYMELKLTEH